MARSLSWTFAPSPVPGFDPAGSTAPAAAVGASHPQPLPQRAQMADADKTVAELDERELVDACLANQPGAFDLIVERHRRSIYQLCYRFVGNHEDANDLSQDVFIRAFRGLRTFRGQSSLATWLYRIGVNVCLNRVSAKTTLGKLTEPMDNRQFVDAAAESASDRLLKDERAARVRAAITQLPPAQRATLILRTYHEMSHQEIAGVLGSSVGAVKANFFHALANLKKLLGEEIQ
jgi:RNA polymerase sigma-70 factor (ECF subfamily)